MIHYGYLGKEKRTFTDPNELHNEEAMEIMLKSTGLKTIDLERYPQASLKNKMGNFYEADIQKAYAPAQGKYNESVIIASI